MKPFVIVLVVVGLLVAPFIASFFSFQDSPTSHISGFSSEAVLPSNDPLVRFYTNEERALLNESSQIGDVDPKLVISKFREQIGLPAFQEGVLVDESASRVLAEGIDGKEESLLVAPSANPFTLSAPRVELTDKQVHDRVWPEHYRESLRSIQAQMVETEFLATDEEYDFDLPEHEEDIYVFLDQSLDWAVSVELVKPEHAPDLRRGLSELRRLIAKEKSDLKYHGRIGAFLFPPLQEDEPDTPFTRFTHAVRDLLTIHVANAQWVSAPVGFCWKAAGLAPPPGPNLWSFCCNCGIVVRTIIPFFAPECLPFGAFCDIPLGCLNLMCMQFPTGLWDGPPGLPPGPSGICGCGP